MTADNTHPGKKGITRRDFLKFSSLALGGLVLPTLPRYLIPDEYPPGNNPGYVNRLGEKDTISQAEIDFLSSHKVWYGDRKRKVVLMTYDDGGGPDNINKILETYKNVGGKTTFFVPGRWLEQPQNAYVAEKIVVEGHTLGCHGYVI